jgi:hypothetical protein
VDVALAWLREFHFPVRPPLHGCILGPVDGLTDHGRAAVATTAREKFVVPDWPGALSIRRAREMKEEVASTVVSRTAVFCLCYIPENTSAVDREIGG